MKEEKFKRIVIGGTVAAVVLLVFLIVFMIYQLVSVSQKRSLEQELLEQIELYEQMAEDKAGDISIYKDRVWLEMAARKLGLLGAGDVADRSTYIAAAEALRLGEGEILHLHDKAHRAASLAAAEAVEDLLALADREGGGLFPVEGTQTPVVAPLPGQGDVGGHHVHNVEPAAELVQKLFRYGHDVTSILAFFWPFYLIIHRMGMNSSSNFSTA